ncbi:MAG: FG-GAP repeat protein, partial [Magnetococcales bacterium]|nr:FG-GAP repeat protein [Magnetococcales bacterium]
YRFQLQGQSSAHGTLGDPVLRLLDSAGSQLAYNDDYGSLDSQIDYTATLSGTYYLDAASLDSNTGGSYRIVATVLNHAPVLSVVNSSVEYTVNSAALTLAPALILSDVEGDLVSSATVHLSGMHSTDLLAATGTLPGSISADYDDVTGILTLLGSASVADYQAALRTVTFTGSEAGTHTLSWTIHSVSGSSSQTVESLLEVLGPAGPTLTSMSPFSGSTPSGSLVSTGLSALLTHGDEYSDGSTVNAFVVKSVAAGSTLLIGQNVYEATPWVAGSNDVIDLTHDAYWISAAGADGLTDAFSVVARDANGQESATPVAVQLTTVLQTDVGQSTTTAGLLLPAASLNETVTLSGTLDSDTDQDWYRVYLDPGVVYHFEMQGTGTGSNTLPDAYLQLVMPGGMGSASVLVENDDVDGNSFDSAFDFVSNNSMLVYMNAASSAVNPGSGTYTLSVTPIAMANNPVQVTATVAPVNYVEGAASVVLNDALVLSDSDGTHISSATVIVKGYQMYAQGRDQLGFASGNGYANAGTWSSDFTALSFTAINGTAIDAVWYADNGYLSIYGAATLADYQDVLRSVTYSSGDATTVADRVILLTVQDVGYYDNNPFNVMSLPTVIGIVQTTGVDGAPLLSNSGSSPLYGVANAAAVILAPELKLSDLDSTSVSGATVHIGTGFHTGDILSATDLAGGLITADYDAVNGTLTLTGSATVAEYQAALRSVTFEGATVAVRDITWTVTADGLSSAVLTTQVDTISTLALSSLDGSNGFLVNDLPSVSPQAVTSTKTVVAAAGDFNGDGFGDLIVGGPSGYSNYGGAYLVFGSANGVGGSSLSLSNLSNHGVAFHASNSYDADFGFSVSSAGDINGDGLADLIIGAPNQSVDGHSNAGTAYIVFGSTAGSFAPLDTFLDGSNGFRIEGLETAMKLGQVVQGIGDLNGDGFADFALTAPGATVGQDLLSAGSVYVVFGKSGAFNSLIDLNNLDGNTVFRLDGEEMFGMLGLSVSAAGDVNGDGYADMVVGNGLSSSYVLFGQAEAFASSMSVSSLDGSNGFRLVGDAESLAGASVSPAGDFNGDGFADLLIGAPSAASVVHDWSYVVYGKGTAFASSIDLTTLSAAEGFRLSLGNATDYFGGSVASIGDFNGDGYDDLLVSAELATANGVTAAGASYVIFGHGNTAASALDLTALDASAGFRLVGAITNDRAGVTVSGAGDVNGDGYADLIVGSKGSGNSYVVYGHANAGATVLEGDTYSPTNAVDELFVGGSTSYVEQHIETGGGMDVVHAGAGNDAIRVSDLNFRLIDGGAGVDQLQLDLAIGVHHTVDLADYRGALQSIEKIHLWNADTTLVVSAVDLCNLSESSNVLTVQGNLGQVELVGVWQTGLGYSETEYGTTYNYHVYTSGAAVLRVADNLSVYHALQQVDFGSAFNADLVGQSSEVVQVNGLPAIDNTNADFSVDGAGSLYITQAVAEGNALTTPTGLANDGFYAANADHPTVLLQANETDSGDNALQVTGYNSVNLNVQDGVYDTLHVFAVAGNLITNTVTDFHVVLHYTDSTTTTSASIPVLNWYDGAAYPSVYTLIGGMNRGDGSSLDDGNGAAIFGFAFEVDASKVLASFDLVTNDVDANATVNYFGATLEYHSSNSPVDHAAPEILSYTATMAGSLVTLCSDITLHFNESVMAASGGEVVISNGDNDVRTISLSDTTQVTIVGHDVIINPTDDLGGDYSYTVTMASGALTDLSGNRFAGISSAMVAFSTEVTLSDPLVIDLNGNGIHLSAISDSTMFDMNADGVSDRSGWFGQGNGVLVVDTNHNGQIDGIQEMLSGQFVNDVSTSSLAALATLDSNSDGRIDGSDAAFDQLQVWEDVNQDGISSADELHSLRDLGIAALGLSLDSAAASVNHGNRINGVATVEFADGHLGSMAEVQFSYQDALDETAIQQVTHVLDPQTVSNWESDALAELVARALAARDGVGASHVVFGHASNFDTPLDIPSLDGKTGFRLYAADAIVGHAGDLSGDSLDDLVIGYHATDGAAQHPLFAHDGDFGFAAMLDATGLELHNPHGERAGDWLTGGEPLSWDSYPNAALALSHLATLDGQQSGLDAGNHLLIHAEQAVSGGVAWTGHGDLVSDFNPSDALDSTADGHTGTDPSMLESVPETQEGAALYLLDTDASLDLTQLLASQAQNAVNSGLEGRGNATLNMHDLLDFSGSNHSFAALGEAGGTLHLQQAMDSLLASSGAVLVEGSQAAAQAQEQTTLATDTYVVHQPVDGLHTLLVGSEIVFNFTR